MKDEEIVRQYLHKGKLLSPQALEAIKRGAVPADTNLLVLTERELQQGGEKIIKCLHSKKKELTTEDFVSFYTSKFQKMQKVILSRIQKNFISINKIGSDRKEVYTIGIVRDVRERGEKHVIEIEDMTGTAPVTFDAKQEAEIDDVVAVHAAAGGDVLFGKAIFYPDVPLRQPIKGLGKACFVSDLHLNECPRKDAEKLFSWFSAHESKHLFIAGDVGDYGLAEELISRYCIGKRIFVIPGEADTSDEYPQLPIEVKGAVALSNPAVVELNGIKILMIHDLPNKALQKRYLGKSTCVLPEDFLALEDVPDIVHCGHTHKPHVSNYKSITIVNSGSLMDEFRPVVVDFSTREAAQVSVG